MWLVTLTALTLGAQAQPAQPTLMGPIVPRARSQRTCEQPDPDSQGSDEIVVCGQDSENSPYRIPRALRQRQNQIEDSGMSWDARTRDMEAMERFSSQNVGPSGISQRSRQIDCEYRVARQIAQGRQPDCGARSRRDQPTDWQRR